MKLISVKNQDIISNNVIIADSFLKKFFGLTTSRLKNDECFLIPNCNSIHTIGMSYSLDIVFLDRDYKIVKIINSLKPFRFTPFIKKARNVLEFRANSPYRINLKLGDKLSLI